MRQLTPVQEYYAQKELIYAAQKKCADLYNAGMTEAWEIACDQLYKLEQECEEIAKRVFI